jgi:hypothetical protein
MNFDVSRRGRKQEEKAPKGGFAKRALEGPTRREMRKASEAMDRSL